MEKKTKRTNNNTIFGLVARDNFHFSHANSSNCSVYPFPPKTCLAGGWKGPPETGIEKSMAQNGYLSAKTKGMGVWRRASKHLFTSDRVVSLAQCCRPSALERSSLGDTTESQRPLRLDAIATSRMNRARCRCFWLCTTTCRCHYRSVPGSNMLLHVLSALLH